MKNYVQVLGEDFVNFDEFEYRFVYQSGFPLKDVADYRILREVAKVIWEDAVRRENGREGARR